MKKIISIFTTTLLLVQLVVIAQSNQQRPVPSPSQLSWHGQEFYLFAHFGPNTFIDLEWGHGDEKAEVFNPSNLDCEQWCRIAKEAGATGIIITAKHHDGFCLWPSKFSTHTVRESVWKNGKGDVLAELSAACKKYGIKFGVYISPWDRNHPDYGTEKYNDIFVEMMKELFINYGPIWELWWDGANGEGPNGKRQVYDWARFKSVVKELSPNTVIFSDVGPHIRWVGNEKGIAGETNWNYLDTAGFTPGLGAPTTAVLNTGNRNGQAWIPAECDVSIRPGWFYHAEEDEKVKTPEQLFNLYLKSVGRGANLLLNVPPDRRGLIHENDSAALVNFKHLRIAQFSNRYLRYKNAEMRSSVHKSKIKITHQGMFTKPVMLSEKDYSELFIRLPKRGNFNCVILQEEISEGQNCAKFVISLKDKNNKLIKEITGTTIGHKRVLCFPEIKNVKFISLRILDQDAPTILSSVEFHKIDDKLVL